MCLTRSRRCPLSIQICDDRLNRVPDSRSAQILTALAPHASRWQDIHLSIPNSSIIHLQQYLPPAEGFQALRALTLNIQSSGASYTSLDISALGIPWNRLTELYLRLESDNSLTLDQCLCILAEGANLVICTLNTECMLDFNDMRVDKIPLHSMQSFELVLLTGRNEHRFTEGPVTCLITFLEQLEFSQLQNFAIDSLVRWDDANVRHWHEAHQRFTSILGSISPSLEALRIAYLPLSEDQLIDGLGMLPLLINLDLRFSMADRDHDPITDRFLTALTLPDRQLLCQLESLNVRCNGARFSTSVLLGLVHSRWSSSPLEKAHKRLKAFSFISLRPIGKFARQSVKTWGEEGLIVTMKGTEIR